MDSGTNRQDMRNTVSPSTGPQMMDATTKESSALL